jgi:hypothetical protein
LIARGRFLLEREEHCTRAGAGAVWVADAAPLKIGETFPLLPLLMDGGTVVVVANILVANGIHRAEVTFTEPN